MMDNSTAITVFVHPMHPLKSTRLALFAFVAPPSCTEVRAERLEVWTLANPRHLTTQQTKGRVK